MHELLVILAIISLLVGFLLGIMIVLLILFSRKFILTSNLNHLNGAIGEIAVVQVPFDYSSKGKIRVRVDKSIRELIAITDYPHRFEKGEKVLIVEVHNSHAWIHPYE